jgi:uncharacterized protein (TIGR03492 family)
MMRVLFVSNGHGEAAIADRIAADLRIISPQARLDHLPLVGTPTSETMREVGPRRAMPSGGLIAMGNLRNLWRDLQAGLLALVGAQRRFLRRSRGSYDVAVAVGDAYALAMTLRLGSQTVFVGTAKSVNVAPYGPFEERLLARTQSCFVRDEETARALRARGLRVEPAANVIVDLFVSDEYSAAQPAVRGFTPALALFPGSRTSAYDDGGFLLRVVRELAVSHAQLGAVLSVSRGLDPDRFESGAQRQGWEVRRESHPSIPFALLLRGRVVVRAWTGSLAALLGCVSLVLGQAGTANEGAAASGVPVVAFARDDGQARWYRRRQQALLGEALAVLPGNLPEAVAGVGAIINDAARRSAMSETGRRRMGPSGGAARIAERIAILASRP